MRDYYTMTLEQIEKELNIETFNKELHEGVRLNTRLFDEWEQVNTFLQNQDSRFDRVFSCFGYELVEDNNYIKLYYTTNQTNS